MNIEIIDLRSNYNYKVGDKFFEITNVICKERVFDAETVEFNIIPEISTLRIIYPTGRKIGWSLNIQAEFIIINHDTREILFDSNPYSTQNRHDPKCEFYIKLQEFFDTFLDTTGIEFSTETLDI